VAEAPAPADHAPPLLEIDDVGVMQALVRWQRPVRPLVPTAVSVSLAASGALYALAFVLAPVIASALHAPSATGPMRVLALIAVVDGLAAVPAALLTREFRQDLRARADLSGLVVNVVVGIALAVAGAGVWSFVGARLSGNVVAMLLVRRYADVPLRPGFDRDGARELLAFGAPLASGGLVNFALLNVDYVVVGRLLGPVQLGYYVLAFNVASTPVNVITAAVRRVSVPALARCAPDPVRLRSAVLGALRSMVAAAVLLGVLLAGLASHVVDVVYGSRWAPSGPVLAFLALLGVARVVINLCEDVFVAVGRSRAVLALQSTWLLLLAPAVVVAASGHGVRAVAAVESAVGGVVMAAGVIAVGRLVGLGRAAMVGAVWRPVAGAAIASMAVAAVASGTRGAPGAAVLVIGTALGTIAYAVVVVRRDEVSAARRLRSRRGLVVE